jgi:cell division septum initiation protein DivIVA
MTQTEMTKFLNQINEAFKDQFDKLEHLQVQLDQLEAKINEQEKRSKTGASRGKRVQQAKENA